MYANIAHYLDENWNSRIKFTTWSAKGERIDKDEPFHPYIYIEDASGEHTTMFNTRAKKLSFDNIIQKKKWLREHEGMRIFEDIKPERQFLIERFENADFKDMEKCQSFPFHTHFFDIEIIDLTNEFPEPREAKYPIGVITTYDNFLDEFHVFVLDRKSEYKFESDEPNTVFHIFNKEVDLLRSYINWFKENRPDVLSGFHSVKFDVPYIIRRSLRFMPEDEVNELSPVNSVWQKFNVDKERPEYIIEGVAHLDYLMLYKNLFGSKLNSYKLDNVCYEELGYGKLEYEGTIKEFSKNDFVGYVKYNIIDVKRLKELEDKLGFFSLVRRICNEGLCEYEGIHNTSRYITGALVKQAHKNNQVLMTNSGKDHNSSHFTGAYVFEPQAGVYRNGVACIDLNSLYPNTMITLNIGPETKVGKIVEENDDTIEVIINGKSSRYNKDKFYKKIQGKLTKSANGILYLNPEIQEGIIPGFLKRFYRMRKERKAEMRKLIGAKEGADDNKKNKIDRLISQYKVADTSYKVFLNAIYGQLGNKYFALFDIDNAEAVTLSGQLITKECAKITDELFKNKYGACDSCIIGGDTDSLFLNLESFVKTNIDMLNGDDITDSENVKKICNKFDNEVLSEINNYCNHISEYTFVSPLRRLEFGREYFASHGAFLAKKRYCVNIKEEEGVFCDKWKYTGMEIKKKEIAEHAKKHLQYVTESSILEEWDSQKFNSELKRIYDEFCNMSIEQLAWYQSYSTSKNSNSGIFLDTAKGAGVHARSAEYYNAIIEKLNLTNKYDKIQIGDTIRYVYLTKNNQFGINCIGFLDQYPDEFKKLFDIHYKKMFDKIIVKPLKRFIEINNWSYSDVTKNRKRDVLDL